MDEKKNKEKEESLIAVNIESRISEKGSRNHPLTGVARSITFLSPATLRRMKGELA